MSTPGFNLGAKAFHEMVAAAKHVASMANQIQAECNEILENTPVSVPRPVSAEDDLYVRMIALEKELETVRILNLERANNLRNEMEKMRAELMLLHDSVAELRRIIAPPPAPSYRRRE